MKLKKLKIDIKQEHIDAGDGKSPRKCAIALALRERGFSAEIFGFGNSYVRDVGAMTLDDAGRVLDSKCFLNLPVEPCSIELNRVGPRSMWHIHKY